VATSTAGLGEGLGSGLGEGRSGLGDGLGDATSGLGEGDGLGDWTDPRSGLGDGLGGATTGLGLGDGTGIRVPLEEVPLEQTVVGSAGAKVGALPQLPNLCRVQVDFLGSALRMQCELPALAIAPVLLSTARTSV
jgi:hypothetical protein